MSRCPACGMNDCCGGSYSDEVDALTAVLKEAQWAIKALAPGMTHIYDIDFSRLNTAMIAVDKALSPASGEGKGGA